MNVLNNKKSIDENNNQEQKNKKVKKVKKVKKELQLYYDNKLIEVGIDEAGRGCLSGRVYVGAVILPKSIDDDIYKQIKDSKKLSRKKRKILRKYIEKTALAYSVAYATSEEIDQLNILEATLQTMHTAISGLSIEPEQILVDGNRFHTYMSKKGNFIPHELIKGGDNLYYSIAAASILAKVYHDEYIEDLCEEDPSLQEKYNWLNNMCYGTKAHLEGIKKYGVTKHHRKSFKPCQLNYKK